jgi:DNA (cytosine-5)-methyltransferase 1
MNNYLDLFHGIGGFALGAYWAGMKFDNHYCSDNEKYCQKLYELRFPDSVQLGDISKIDTKKLPVGEWILTGGFPCQDISLAGKGAGIEGKKSSLWFEYWRLIRDLRPKFAIVENVPALTFRGLNRVLGSLAEIGYNAEWQIISANDFGAPHLRKRIWIISYPNCIRSQRSHKKGAKKKNSKKKQA